MALLRARLDQPWVPRMGGGSRRAAVRPAGRARLGELAAGTALIAGFRVGLAGTVALAMVLNFQFASGIMFTSGYLTNGYGPPVIGGLAALAIGGGRRLPYSVPW